MRWIWLAAAAAAVGWWLWRRQKAMAGTANTTGAPAGATPGGVVATLQAPACKATLSVGSCDRQALTPKTYLHEVGFGYVAPMQIVNASKPAVAATVVPPKPNNPPNGCGPGKKPTKVTIGTTSHMECK